MLPISDETGEETGSNWLTDLAKDEVAFNQAISTLREFYFIRRNEAIDSLSIHPVVHSWLRQRTSPKDWHSNLSAAITLLGRAVPFAHFKEPWILHRRLAVHVQTILELLRSPTTDQVDSPEGFGGLSVMMFDQCNFEAAEGLYRRSGEAWERRLGFNAWQTRRTYHDLALVYRTLCKYDVAETLWKKLLEESLRSEGYPLTKGACRILADLGRLYTMTKRYDEAETHFSQALEVREGHAESNTARTAAGEPIKLDLGLALGDTCRMYGILKQETGNFEEAETLYQRSLEIFKKKLEANHTWALLVVADLGQVSIAKGDLEKAEMYLRSAMVGMEEQLGTSHNYTVKLYQDLGDLLTKLERREEALILIAKAAKGDGRTDR